MLFKGREVQNPSDTHQESTRTSGTGLDCHLDNNSEPIFERAPFFTFIEKLAKKRRVMVI